jgi:FdhE protein
MGYITFVSPSARFHINDMKSERYLEHIERLIQQRPSTGPSLRSYGELARLMIQTEPAHQPKTAINAHLQINGKDGVPLFSRKDLPLDFVAASLLLNRFFSHLSETKRKDRSGLAKALKESEKDLKWNHRLFAAILNQDEDVSAIMADQVGLDPLTLLFLGKTALRPSLETLRRLMEEIIDEKPWDHGYCPLCGSPPDMARFTKAGKRSIHCELCGQEWAFTRIGCPFCDNRDPEDLGYFEAEGEEGLRVYYCNVCHKYLKTIDSRVFEEVAPLELESLATLHLDLVANRNGYK